MKILLSLLLLSFGGVLWAQEPLPRVEVGIGMLALDSPDYRGSTEADTYLLPAPYLKYRGDRLRVDDGANGIIYETTDLLLTLSGNFSVPVDEDTPEREGMEKLSATVEIGPSLNYRFLRFERSAWWLDIPLRFAFTLDRDFEHIGSVFQPRLSWRKPMRRLGELKLRFNIGPLFSSDAHHDYFYNVATEEATPTRPAYNAVGGFSGIRSEFTFSRRIGEYWVGGFLRYDNLENSKIEDSPLVTDTDSFMVGVGFAWVFYQD